MTNIAYPYILPAGLSPQAIEKIKPELEYALQGHVDIITRGRKVFITVHKTQLPSKIKYHTLPKIIGHQLAVPIGYTHNGPLTLDMASDSHCYMLVGGNPGTGKSNFLNQVIQFLTTTYSPGQVKLILIDLKLGVEFSCFEKLPHTWLTAYDPGNTELQYALEDLELEIRRRMNLFRKEGVRKIKQYHYLEHELPYLMLVIDEYAELHASGKEIESRVKGLLQIGRAAGLRAILATQRPTTDNISGSVKALCTDRLCFQVAGELNSRVILDEPGAEKLPDIPGRGIFLTGAKFQEVQVMALE